MDDDEEYDWCGGENLVDEEPKFESAMGIKQKQRGWGPKRFVHCLKPLKQPRFHHLDPLFLLLRNRTYSLTFSTMYTQDI